MTIRKLLAVSAFLAITASAQAANASVVFSDNFDSYKPALNWAPPPADWIVSSGAVDLIGAGTSYNYYPGNGLYVDLNGSNGFAGTLKTATVFGAGTYTLTFNLGGNVVGPSHGDVAPKTTTISLGNFSTAVTLAANAGFTSQTFTFTTTGGMLSFASTPEKGVANYIGNILDNVVVSSSVPEPATWAVMLLGMLGLGFMMRRKQTGVIASV